MDGLCEERKAGGPSAGESAVSMVWKKAQRTGRFAALHCNHDLLLYFAGHGGAPDAVSDTIL